MRVHAASSGASRPDHDRLLPSDLKDDAGLRAKLGTLNSRKPQLGSAGLPDCDGPSACMSIQEGVSLIVDGSPAHVAVMPDGIRIFPHPPCWRQAFSGTAAAPQSLRFSEILGVHRLEGPAPAGPCTQAKAHAFALFTLRRAVHKPCQWAPWRIVMESPSQATLSELSAAISNGLAAVCLDRPRHLLVIINPNAGCGQARNLYRTIALPVFCKAGITLQAVETTHCGHAEQLVTNFALSAACEYADGIVAIGGDGIFNEILNGLLAARDRPGLDPARAAMLARLRLAHLPCGSTDALACSLNGTRSVFAAAMHVALGDRTPLDVLRVHVGGQQRFASCIATCGFMSDVVLASERHRWLGSLRYDITGALTLAANRSYRCRVSYAQGSIAGALQGTDPGPCSSSCSICRSASLHWAHSAASLDLESGSRGGGAERAAGRIPLSDGARNVVSREPLEKDWTVVEDDFMSVMLIVQPCLSDKTPHGMARHGHLADGRFKLVLVRRCSPLQYLLFLITMSSKGLAAGQVPAYVSVIDAVACRVESQLPGGENFHWNLDGELVHAPVMEAEARHGLVHTFARGVER